MPRLLPMRLTLIAATLLTFSAFAFGQVETILHDFIALPHGGTPVAPLVADSAGNLYGTTESGGLYGAGTVFELTQSSSGKWTQTVLYNFTDSLDGGYPTAGLTFDGAGNLYGTTSEGGANCVPYQCYAGTVFKLAPNSNGTWTLTTLYSFGSANDGFEPLAGVVFDTAGNLYGTTQNGGASDYGTVFELTPNSQGGWSETILWTFADGSDGGTPLAGLTLDSAGNVYGTTSVGGDLNCNNFDEPPYGCGVVFKLTPSNGTWQETVLHAFALTDGAFPNTNVIFDSSGALVGTTVSGPGINCGEGCGTVFELTPSTGGTYAFKLVYTFAGGLDGATPKGGLVFGSDGNFYGTTGGGGDSDNCQYGCGTVYSLTPSTGYVWKEKIIHHFSGSSANPYGVDGNDPVAGLVFDQSGNLYGTARAGGATGTVCNQCSGTVFKLSKNSSGQWNTALVYSFVVSGDGLSPGGSPISSLASGSAGNFYGVTEYGGANGQGAIYELLPLSGGGYKERVIYSFLGGTDGGNPFGGLISDASGNLYGATFYGGENSGCSNSYGCGTIFELSPTGGGNWKEQVIHAFMNADGVGPSAPLTLDPDGNILGTTGGSSNGGLSTAFQLSPSGGGWIYTILYTFTNNTVFTPGGAIVLDSSGNWYGVGEGGNHGAGVIYELSPGSSGYTSAVLHTFAGGADGSYPSAPLVLHNGILYGVTYEGGSNSGYCTYAGCGVAFAVAKSGSTWQKKNIYTFQGGADASNPAYGLTIDSAGNFYGSSWAGGSLAVDCRDGNGSGGCGAVFRLTESGGQWSESVVHDFGLIPYDIYDPGNLLWTSSNILYGAGGGGDDGNGAVFELDLNQASRSASSSQLQPPPQWHPHQARAAAQAKSGKGDN